MQEFHDLPLAGPLGKRKTHLKLRDTSYFPYMRKYIFKYVSACDRCQKFNYKDALPAGRLTPIVSNYPNEIVTLDLLGPYPASRPERYRFILVITDHFTKWSELIPLRKASAQAIANALLENYISRYGAPIFLISDNGPQFISDVFEHLSHMLDIKHIKTVTHRLQANLTERVDRTLVQMIASFLEENHDNWDRFLHEFSFALRTAVNETTGNVGLEDLRVKRTRRVVTTGTSERYDRKRPKICRKRSLQGSDYETDKRKAPVLPQGLKRGVLSSISSRTHKHIRKNTNKHPSQGPEILPGTSNQGQMKRFSPTKEESWREARVQSDRARETRTTGSKGHSAAEGRPVRSRRKPRVRPCPYYLKSRFKEHEGLPEEH
ncbi:retrovirus-related Pol polyprotein from transposon 412 [Trichonephila clavipes]|nr:retrovirus-related Pol polyprotein from transposon 412 [Trichonephila clavipes]